MYLNQRGMSIVELMVAMAIGTIISAALASIFVTTTKVKQEIDRNGEQIANGRLAMDWLTQDLRHAGFWDGLEYTGLADPAMPTICSTDPDALKLAAPVFVQGVDNVSSAPSCLNDSALGGTNMGVKLGSDIIVVRRASTCVDGEGACDTGPYFQASQCTPPADKQDGSSGTVALGQELTSTTPGDWYVVSNTVGDLTMHARDCANPSRSPVPPETCVSPGCPPIFAAKRRYLMRIYFIANSDRAGDRLPTLKMAELRGTTWTYNTIASGIEQMQIEYGQDTGGDTTPESYVAAPSSVADWRQMVAVKVHLLSRNSSETAEHTDRKVYVLGGNEYCASRALTAGPSSTCTELGNTHVRRHAFSGQVGIRNPVGLRGG